MKMKFIFAKRETTGGVDIKLEIDIMTIVTVKMKLFSITYILYKTKEYCR